MNVDKALANFCVSSEIQRGGDIGKRRAEHRNFLQLRTINYVSCRSEALIRYQTDNIMTMKYSEVLW